MPVNQKKIVITGAGRGLGRALARDFVAGGAQVAVLGRGGAALDRTVELCGSGATAFRADVGVAEEVEAAFAGIADTFGGKIDILINNAAIIDYFRVDEAEPARIRRMIDANLLGPMLMTRFAAPLLKANGHGDIINISSESVRNPFSFMATYASTKAGLENLSRGLRGELKSFGIRVTTLQVGIMADPEREIDADPATMERFMTDNAAAIMASGGEMQFSTVAQAIKGIVALSRDAQFEMVELRPI